VAAKRPSKDVMYTAPVALRGSRSLSSGRPLRAAPVGSHLRVTGREALLDLIFAKFDVFLGDRVVFLLHQFVGHGARILPRHIIKTGIRTGYEFDFYRGVLGHKTLKIATLGAS
jgi:hypothetical protein